MSVTASQIYDEIGYDIRNAIRDSSATMIPAYSLSTDDINRINHYFQTNLNSDDIVCLVSNSIMNTGKSGAVFTVDGFYYKGWLSRQVSFEFYFSYDTFDNNYDIFYVNSLREVMRQANDFIEKTERQEARLNGLKELLGEVYSPLEVINCVSGFVSDIRQIYQVRKLEKRLCELYKRTGVAYIEPELLTLGDSFDYYVQLQQLNKFIDEVINDLENLKISDLDYSEYFARILVLVITFSIIILKISKDNIISCEEFISQIFMDFGFPIDFLMDIASGLEQKGEEINLTDIVPGLKWEEEEISLMDYGLDDSLNDSFNDIINSFVDGTIEYASHWATEDDYILLEEGNILIDCIIKITNFLREIFITTRMLTMADKVMKKREYELYMDICINKAKINKEAPVTLKNIINGCLKMQKQIREKGFGEIVKCAPDIDIETKYFYIGMAGLLGIPMDNYDYPILSVVLNEFFCSGIVVSKEKIIWNFLPESPESRICKAIKQYNGVKYNENELKEGECGYISLLDVKDIITCTDYNFVIISVISQDGSECFLPISLLPVDSSEVLCRAMQEIVRGITNRKFSKKISFSLNNALKNHLTDILEEYNLLSINEDALKDRMKNERKQNEKKQNKRKQNERKQNERKEQLEQPIKNEADSYKIGGCRSVFLWIFACVFWVMGLLYMCGGGVVFGMIWVVIGFVLCPKIKRTIRVRHRIIISIILYFLSAFFV